MDIVWSPQSLRDLDAIHEYIAKDSEHYADLTVARIFAAVERLLRFPHSGRIVPERDEPEIREIIIARFRSYIVFGVRGLRLQPSSGHRENLRRSYDPRQWPVSGSSKPRGPVNS